MVDWQIDASVYLINYIDEDSVINKDVRVEGYLKIESTYIFKFINTLVDDVMKR